MKKEKVTTIGDIIVSVLTLAKEVKDILNSPDFSINPELAQEEAILKQNRMIKLLIGSQSRIIINGFLSQ